LNKITKSNIWTLANFYTALLPRQSPPPARRPAAVDCLCVMDIEKPRLYYIVQRAERIVPDGEKCYKKSGLNNLRAGFSAGGSSPRIPGMRQRKSSLPNKAAQ
jgi:hypothetical protein